MEWMDAARADHTCACTNCDASLAVVTERQGDQHVAVRFWDRVERRNIQILLEGKPVTRAFEAILGEEGTVWRYREHIPNGNVHRCLTCLDRGSNELRAGAWYDIPPCTEKLHGRVELRRLRTEVLSG